MEPKTSKFANLTRRAFITRSALAAGAVIGTGAVLTACGGSSGNDSPSQVTLRFADWMAKGEDHPILDDFMKANPNIKVIDDTLPGGTYDQALKPRFIGGNGPDVFLYMDYIQYIPFIQQGWLMDVTNEPGTKSMTQNQQLATHYSINGKIYGAIVNGNYADSPMFFNQKYFDKLKLTPPTTVDEFYALCEKLKADGTPPLVFGGKDSWTIGTLTGGYESASIAAKYGVDANADLLLAKGKAKVEDIYGNAWRFFANLNEKGYIAKASQTLTYDQSVQYFVDGKAAMLPQGPWVAGLDPVKQADANVFKLSSFAFPFEKYNGKIVTSFGADRTIGINANTKYPKESKLLYNFFLEKANLKKYLETQSLFTLTPGTDLAIDPVLQDYYTKHQDTSLYDVIIPQAAPDPNAEKVSIPTGYTDARGQAYADLLAGASYAEVAKKVQDAFDRVKGQIIITKA